MAATPLLWRTAAPAASKKREAPGPIPGNRSEAGLFLALARHADFQDAAVVLVGADGGVHPVRAGRGEHLVPQPVLEGVGDDPHLGIRVDAAAADLDGG